MPPLGISIDEISTHSVDGASTESGVKLSNMLGWIGRKVSIDGEKPEGHASRFRVPIVGFDSGITITDATHRSVHMPETFLNTHLGLISSCSSVQLRGSGDGLKSYTNMR